MERLTFTIKALVPSKKNNLRPKQTGGFYYDKDMKLEIDYLSYEIKKEARKAGFTKQFTGNVEIDAVIYTSRDQDTDNMYTTVQDAIQSAGIIKNDKNVSKFTCERIVVQNYKDSMVTITVANRL
jgi:Holliday junction resolvase RusA-like endonuclease